MIAGRYALDRELGRGGMARVVAARDLRLHRTVAVKLLPVDTGAAPDQAARRRFVREARAAAAFTHPHAVAVYDAGDADGYLYLVMELVDGPSLATLLAARGRLGIDESLRLVDQVLQALGAAHRAGIVHRDVKPANVLVSSDGVAKLADFGIAKRADDRTGELTLAGQFIGTPTYLSPEQVAGRPVTAATDLYSTGVLLFEMLAGAPPFDGGTPLATALAHRDAPAPDVRTRRADVPDHVAQAVRRAMAKDPAARFDTAEEMRAALGGARPRPLAGAPTLVASRPPPAAPVPTQVMPARRSRRRWWLAGVAVLALAGAGVALALRGDPGGAGSTATSPPATQAPVATTAPTAAATTTTTALTTTTTTSPPTTATVALTASTLDQLVAPRRCPTRPVRRSWRRPGARVEPDRRVRPRARCRSPAPARRRVGRRQHVAVERRRHRRRRARRAPPVTRRRRRRRRLIGLLSRFSTVANGRAGWHLDSR